MALYGSDDHPIIETLIDGTWTDVSARVRGEQKVVISRGRTSEQSRPSAQRANLTFENADGYFSNRLPTSTNYRKLGKNTQLRVRAGSGDNHVRLPFNDQQTTLEHVTTADKAVLDITGDIDIRMELWPHSWRPPPDLTLAAKYQTASDQRSWMITLGQSGQLALLWSSAGTLATRIDISSTASVPASSGRLAIRVTLDVNNGAGGNTVTFYTSDSISGSWTTLGSAVVTAGTTSIFASTTNVTVGGSANSRGGIGSNSGFGGKIYAFEMYNGIAGTLVARMDATSRSIGDTSWSDGLGTPNTWTIAGDNARLTSDRVRFWGELHSLPQRWDVAGIDVAMPAQASGLMRRLSQGAKPLDSAMRRNFLQHDPFDYWPMEDGSDSTTAASSSSRAGSAAGTIVDATFGSTDTPPGSAGAIAFSASTSQFLGKIKLTELFAPATFSIVFYVRVDALPASAKVFFTMVWLGQFARVDVSLSSTVWTVEFYDITGVSLGNSATAITDINPANGWIGYNLLLQDSGSDFTYSQRWDAIGTYGGGSGPTTIAGYSLGEPKSIKFFASNDTTFNAMRISQVFLSQDALDLSDGTFRDASNAYALETAAARLKRLSDEEGVAIEITGLYADSEPMGYQTPGTYLDLAAECWDTDGGIGGETRDALMLAYRTRADMESREDVVFTYTDSELSDVPQPSDDDLGLMNDVTVTRTGGSSYRAVVTEGYNSISEPPDGVGKYAAAYTLNVATDERLPSAAGWIALVGTWDQDRYPSVAVALHRSALLADTAQFASVVAANLGDTAVLADLPSWMPPDDVAELIQGYQETLSRFMWDISFNATPAGPYRAVPVLGSAEYVPRLDATTHTSSGSLTTTATSVTLITPAGSARWADSATYPSDFPMDLDVDGEVVTLTAVTGTSSPQTGTITRSVNGVVKAHDAGALVRLAEVFYVGR
jgi:hypothetical protein